MVVGTGGLTIPTLESLHTSTLPLNTDLKIFLTILDWVWENCRNDPETLEFLSWICDSKNIASFENNILTDEELQKWETLQTERPEAILSGNRLQEAIRVVR